ncbi:MAG: hypothetical protein OXN84_15790, partial [Albidovulum sp.]|nr:hypothetical protein [Albidovulum sp.]
MRNELGGDVVSGGWFVFADRRRTMMKIIGFAPGGCWIRAGGSGRGCSRFPPARGASIVSTMESLQIPLPPLLDVAVSHYGLLPAIPEMDGRT